jgi:hypothetical protein
MTEMFRGRKTRTFARSEPGNPEADEARTFPALARSILSTRSASTWICPSGRKPITRAFSRTSEVMNRKRGLTIDMIRKLVAKWHMPAGALVAPCRSAAA